MNMFFKARELFEKDFEASQEVKQYNTSMQGGKAKANKSLLKFKKKK